MTSSMCASNSLADEAVLLIHQLANHDDSIYGLGSMTCAIYDTAWVAMVSKETDGKSSWLFPESFIYLLEHQSDNGSWESYGAQVDGIMNSLAALLALKRHQKQPELSLDILPYDIEARVQRAITSIADQLQAWDVESTMHVGFEYLVPALLTMLEAEEVYFRFAGRDRLMAINHKKMARFRPAMLYGEQKITALHSLEAFIGLIDFDRVQHHKTFGSMMASPSSTAAYLMSASEWDMESEAYLRHVVKFGHGGSSGGVPSAFPSSYFEKTWRNVHALKTLTDLELAPSVGHDADDTAKALLTLALLGKNASPESLISEYEGDYHFRTYASERDPSLSANCNVLTALLHHANPERYLSQIEKCTRFICDEWYRTDGLISDKWNLAQEYPIMLIVQGLTQLLSLYDTSQLPELHPELLCDRIPVVLFQALVRSLKSQGSDGSWRSSVEVTAYAVLTLANLASLPWLNSIADNVIQAIRLGRQYIESHRHEQEAEKLWIEKVTYGSKTLYKAYTLAALHVATPTHQFGEKIKTLVSIPQKKVVKFAKFYSMLPIYSTTPEWLLHASLIEGYLFLPRLKQMRHTLFPRDNMAEDKYFEYIPFTWTGANNRDGAFVNANFLFDMMVVSFLGYQVDEYMETVVGGKAFEHRLAEVVAVIDEMFAMLDTCPSINRANGFARLEACNNHLLTSHSPAIIPGHGDLDTMNKSRSDLLLQDKTLQTAVDTKSTLLLNSIYTPPTSPITAEKDDQLRSITRVLSDFVHFIWHHPSVASASSLDRQRVRNELRTYLLAHLTQVRDNTRFNAQSIPSDRTTTFKNPTSSYYQWVRTTSADHTSCPHAFAFATCLLSKSNGGGDCFKTAREKYVAEDLCRHLASMCRQYNDYGSLQRDRDDGNLNSVNFPEFVGEDDRVLKDELFAIAEYERMGLDMAMDRLRELTGSRREGRAVMKGVELFVDVTDVYGQMYVLRDIDGPVETGGRNSLADTRVNSFTAELPSKGKSDYGKRDGKDDIEAEKMAAKEKSKRGPPGKPPGFGGPPGRPQGPEDPNIVEWGGPDDPENPMNFPRRKKWMMTVVMGLMTFCITFASSVFSTAAEATAAEFGVSMEVMTLGTSLFVLGFALGPIVWGPFSELFGRKIPLFIGFFIFAIFQIPVAVAQNIETIMLCRFLGGLFGSAPLGIVGGAMADFWQPLDRGIAICIFSAATFLGPVAGPIAGGFITMSSLGWRWTEYLTAIMGFSFGLLGLFTVPETFAPVLLSRKAKRMRYKTLNWALHARSDEQQVKAMDLVTKFLFKPFKMLFLDPILLLITLYMSLIYGCLYLLFVAYPIAFSEIRGWNLGIGALPFAAVTVGVFLGALLIVVHSKTRYARLLKEHGHVVPEERLIPMMVGGIIFPAGLFWFAWTSSPHITWVPQVLSGIFIGGGVLLIFLQGLNYIIDCYKWNSASAIAGNTFFRSLVGAGFPLFAASMFHKLGVAWAASLLGFLASALAPVPFLFFVYGKKIRDMSKFSPTGGPGGPGGPPGGRPPGGKPGGGPEEKPPSSGYSEKKSVV
ncbi:hypothetical protein FKW77_002408 [Venturia effusa]|uniref:Major facilitator superfamily (MFS) profile domain-containing protein n=1 Tax=Venturia effusa TaxID=50376 RepID=A0A517LGP7_9PEZI|nr:hypothetical protein FKW77_002408 [Venturia effusa]